MAESPPVYASHRGDNADLFKEVCRLYVPDGAVIADVTWGRGAFWNWTSSDGPSFTLLKSDLHPKGPDVKECDFRALPYLNGSVDVVVLDPPYVHNPGNHITDSRYNNAATTRGMYNADIMELYGDGMAEAKRVLKPEGGQLWVKCKDEVESGAQRWSHIALYHLAHALGFAARDLFVLTPDSRTSPGRWKGVQRHARKNHSYLWVFELGAYRRLADRPPPSGGYVPLG